MKATRLDEKRNRRHTEDGFWAGNLIDEYLSGFAVRTPDKTAVIDRDRSWTYRDLDDTVNRFASALHAHGVGEGDVVSWVLPNWVEAIVVHLASLRIGAVSNPIIPIYRSKETAFILRQAASKIVVVPNVFRGFDYPAMIDEIRPEIPELRTVVVIGDTAGDDHVGYDAFLDQGQSTPVRQAGRGADDIALLLYTSGTTSSPKGVLHSHNTLDYENRSIIEFFGLTESDVVFMPSPVGHIIGVLYGMQLPFILGSTVVLLDVWRPERALELIQEHRCSFTVAATPFLHGILHEPTLPTFDISSLRVFACGGADVPPDLIKQATSTLQCMVSRGYGSTEHPTATAGNHLDPVEKRAHTDGRAIGDVRVRVAADGELQVLGPELFLGYLDSTLNADAFTADGWFRTGDLACIDGDGFVEIVGRKKDIIIRGGENISAKEIEDHLFEHPKIEDVAIVASPDPVLAERVCAVVVPVAGESVALSDVVEWLTARQMARQKLPEHLILLDELPRNPSGKVQKFKLRDLAREQITSNPAMHVVS